MNILITLDYELFNGDKAGTVDNCLLKPMEELLKVLDKYNYKITLFVDTVFINRLKELSVDFYELKSEYKKIVSQLRSLHQKGHDLQLHIHPNWLHATYSNGCWHSVLTDFKLSDMSDEEVDRMFSEGISLLENITGVKGQVIAYRAGAYCIQTYSHFKEVFLKYGIRIDSSVNRYEKSITQKHQYYNYLKIPKKYQYRFSNDVTKEDNNGDFIEVSIPTYRVGRYSLVQRKRVLKNVAGLKAWGDGKPGLLALENKWSRTIKNFWNRIKPPRMVASIDGNRGFFLEKLYGKEISRKNYFLIMGHPKNLTMYSIKCLDVLLKNIRSEDSIITITQLYEKMK